jgi:uncharacterized lipoprotein YddW (UPF0748 family)
MRRSWLILLILVGFLLAARFPSQETVAPSTVVRQGKEAPPPGGLVEPRRLEGQALWVVRHTLASPESIARLIDIARQNGYTDLLVQVRGRGDAYYRSSYEPRADELRKQPQSFDPLTEVVLAAHAAGLRVHAWINLFLIADLGSLPRSTRHLVHQHPEWLMVPRGLMVEQPLLSPQSPAFADQLLAYSRQHRTELEGLYATPAHPALREWVVRLSLELVRRYPVDGVHLDYVRYPNREYDFSRASLDQFQEELESRLSAEDQAFLETESEVDPLFYPSQFATEFAAFQRRQVDLLVERISRELKLERPDLIVSAALVAETRQAFHERFQDWAHWARRGWLDLLCPMIYTPQTDRFQTLLDGVLSAAAGRPVWVGIGAYQQGVEQAKEKILAARAAGADGFLLFSYDTILQPSPNHPQGDYLEQLRPLLLPGGGLARGALDPGRSGIE